MGRHIATEPPPPSTLPAPAARHRMDPRPDYPVDRRFRGGVLRLMLIVAVLAIATATTAGLAGAF